MEKYIFPSLDWMENYLKVILYMQEELEVSAEEYDHLVTALYATKDIKKTS